MKKKRKSNFKLLLIILILGVTVGYALLTATLKINGSGRINKASWNIHWENVSVKQGSVVATVPADIVDTDKTIVEYSVVLTKPGDYYEFTVDAKNDGTIDGMVTDIQNALLDDGDQEIDPIPDYLTYSITYADGKEIEKNHLLKAGRSERYKVKVKYKETITNEELLSTDKSLKFRFSVDYSQSNENAIKRDTICDASIYLDNNVTESNYLDKCEDYIDEDIYTYTTDNNEVTITGFKSGYTIQQVKSAVRDIKASKLLNDRNVNIRKVDNNVISFKDGVWAIPLTINGKNVTKISGDAFTDKGITAELVLPPTLVEISDGTGDTDNNTYTGAFSGNDITSVAIDRSMTKVGIGAFANTKLEKVIIPDNVVSIDIGSFYTDTVDEIVIGDGVTSNLDTGIFNFDNVEKLVVGNSVQTIKNITNTPKLKKLEIGSSVETITNGSFQNCKLKRLIIPDNVVYLNFGAFGKCSDMEELVIGDGVVDITSGLGGLTGLKKLVIGNSLETLTNGAFDGTSKLEELTIGNSVKTITNGAFNGSHVEKLVLPDSVETVDNGAFVNCQIKYLDTGNGLKEVGYSAFGGNQFETVIFGDSVETIYSWPFSSSSTLTSVTFGKNVKTINDGTFNNCNLSTVDLSKSSVTTIGSAAFAGNNISTLKLSDTVTTIGNSAFSNNNLTSVTIPDSVTTIGENAFGQNMITKLALGNNIVYLAGFNDNKLTKVNIPSTVTTIGLGAFNNNPITKVTIPAGVTEIKKNAFKGCNLSSVKFNPTTCTVGETPFYKGEGSNENLTVIHNLGNLDANWGQMITGEGDTTMVSGTVTSALGDVSITTN